MAIVYEDTAYGTSTAKGLIERSKQKGYEIVLSEAYAAKFTDATPLVNKIKAAKPDVVFPVSYITDAILIIKTMKQLDVNAAMIGGGAGISFPSSTTAWGRMPIMSSALPRGITTLTARTFSNSPVITRRSMESFSWNMPARPT